VHVLQSDLIYMEVETKTVQQTTATMEFQFLLKSWFLKPENGLLLAESLICWASCLLLKI